MPNYSKYFSQVKQKHKTFLSCSILHLVMIEGPGAGDGRFYWAGCVLTLHFSMGNFVKIFNFSGLAKNTQTPRESLRAKFYGVNPIWDQKN